MRCHISRLLNGGRNLKKSYRKGIATTSDCKNVFNKAIRVDEEYGGNEIIQESHFPSTLLPNTDIFSHVFSKSKNWMHKTFVECSISGKNYTYGQTIDGALRWAASIKRLVPQTPNPTIAFLAPNSPDFVLMLLGTFAAGATVTPINPLYTPEEIATHLRESGASLLVVDALIEPLVDGVFKYLKESQLPVVVIGKSTKGRTNAQDLFLNTSIPMADPVHIDPSSIAFLPFSSGTTGKPKGVQLSHASITNNMSMYMNEHFCALHDAEGDHQDVQLGILPFFHIYGVMGTLLSSTFCGSRIITMPKFDPNLFIKTIKENKMTSLQLVPTLVQFLSECPMITRKDLEKMRSIIVGAAPLSQSVSSSLMKKAPNIHLQEGYGMTETLLTHITPLQENKIGHCGKLLPNCQVKIIDTDSGNSLPSNTPGELWIKTPSVMTGYYNNDESTKEILEDGWLKTGDIAVYTEDGYFNIVDRTKELIKVKGSQVSPTEIEKALMELDGIQEVGIIGLPDEKQGEAPAAFIVKSSEDVTEATINKFMKQRFSRHKQLTGGINFVEKLPRNYMGKLLRRKLKDMV